MKYVSILYLITFCAFFGLYFSCNANPDVLSYDALRLRQKARITGGDADLNDTVVVKRMAIMDENVRVYWNALNKEDGRAFLWDDPECRDDSISPFRPASVTTSIGRLSAMAVAYATKGSAFCGNRLLKRDIVEGMEWMYEHKWSPKHPMYGNWWDWIIGMPGSVNNMLTVMYDDFTPEQRARYIETLDYYAPDVTFEGASTGANKIWQCSSMVLRGILSRDAARIEMGVEGIDSEFKFVDTHDGFYKDGSFLQHQWHPYTGGYGTSFLRDMVYLMELVHGSQWEIGASYLDMLCEWLENAYLLLIVNGAMMDMVRGREIARQAVSDRTTGHSILLSAYNISKMADEEVRKRLQSRVKFEILSDKWRDFITQDAPLWQLPELRAFLNDERIPLQAPEPVHRQFSVMDRVVHRRPEFTLGLAMSSDRIENYESIDSENMMSWHTGDGVTYIYNGDQAQYTDQFWSTVDYYRLPGITVDAQQPHEAKSLVFGEGILYADGYKSPKTWVGGASIEHTYGISGMWFADGKSTLEARKTWFMAGDEIAAFGAGINSTDHHSIETIVDNRKINGVPHIIVDGEEALQDYGMLVKSPVSWVHFETSTPGTGMGYYFPDYIGHNRNALSGTKTSDYAAEQATMQIRKTSRTGSWRDISKYGDPMPVTRDYFTVWFDHGKNPSNATYAYILLPGKTAAELKAYTAEPNIEILVNTPQVQVVRAKKEGITGWNFWEVPTSPIEGIQDRSSSSIAGNKIGAPALIAGMTVSAPASVILRETGTELIIGISDPTRKAKKITLELNRQVSGISVENPNIKLISTAPLKMQVDVDGALGCTRCITFSK